jgi:ubiquinone/menaquinone biosynthesis C-methylase UbiE
MKEWIDYYDSSHSIYVNARHRDVHFRLIADHIISHIPSPDAAVLDYSCGEALDAPRVAQACAALTLVEPAPGLRANLEKRLRANSRIRVLAPEDLANAPDASFDLIVMISVAQYMTEAELDAALALFHRLLKPQGTFALGDVIAPTTGAATDALALLKLAAKEGFFLAALRGLVRTALSNYSQLRARFGLKRYGEGEMIAKLAKAGLKARRAPQNMGHNGARMSFLATAMSAPTKG